MEAAGTAAKDSWRTKLNKKKMQASRDRRRCGGSGRNQAIGTSSSSYTRREATIRRKNTMQSERSRNLKEKDSNRNRKDIEHKMEPERSARSKGGMV